MESKWIIKQNWLLLIVLLACFLPTTVVSARDGDQPESPSQCVACHQDLYLYYDTGKHYCLCETQVACSDCHHGDPQALTAEAAHIGMVARPACLQHNTCADCHPAEYQQRIDEFAAVAGLHATPCPLPECEHSDGEMIGNIAECSESTVLPWRQIAAGLLGASSLGLIVFAVFLYKKQSPNGG